MINAVAIIESTSAIGESIAEGLSGNTEYRLLLMSHDQAKLVALNSRLRDGGAESFGVSCVRDASWEADIIIIVAPYGQDVAEKIREVATGKIVIVIFSRDATADSHRDMDLQKWLPHSTVVKTFITLNAGEISAAVRSGNPVDAFIAGNSPAASETVSAVMEAAGFRLVDKPVWMN